MPRQRSSATEENEARISAAVNAYLIGTYKSVAKAAHAYDVAPSTVRHHVRGRQSRVQSHQHQQISMAVEEDELVRWITQLTAIGYAPGFAMLREMAEELRRQYVRSINADGIECVSYPSIGKQWANRFLARHPDLKSTVEVGIDAVRVKDVTKERLLKWFDDVQRVFEQHHIDL